MSYFALILIICLVIALAGLFGSIEMISMMIACYAIAFLLIACTLLKYLSKELPKNLDDC